ncbi:hypothetical protein KIN20_016356 [Parelaphostrongylus tenuis]|uniref:Lipoprotein n=1 Tax=Parelaphostrongylus tenuis TaxID=148309 RepID=A0AAD5MGB8_PARTN|nr:hypothetical protein KIN20_016356 [Parelaphostrongylus tenuis]
MAKVPKRSLLIFLLSTGAVLGCGTLPGGPGSMRTWRFNVTGFSLPVAMAFSTMQQRGTGSPDFTEFRFSRSIREASYSTRVHDVLEQQGRAAGLPDFVITTILGQVGINVLYTPLPCPLVSVNPNGLAKHGHRFYANSPSALINFRNSHDLQSHHGDVEQEMWQSVVNRVLRMITTVPFGTHFATAVAIQST